MGAQLVIDRFLYSVAGMLTMYSKKPFISVAHAGNISRNVYGLIRFCERVFSCSRDRAWILIRANLCIICILAWMCQLERTDGCTFWNRYLQFACT